MPEASRARRHTPIASPRISGGSEVADGVLRDLLLQLKGKLPAGRVETHARELSRVLRNVSGRRAHVDAIVRPENSFQVSALVEAAAQRGVSFHTISTGRNSGYGEAVPPTDVRFLLDLHGLDGARPVTVGESGCGSVEVEPGVTQGRLARRLLLANSPFLLDVTSDRPATSLTGNTLNGGYGWTPLGDRLRHVSWALGFSGQGAVAFGQGAQALRTFLQARVVITAMKVPLLRRPDFICGYAVRLSLEDGEVASLLTRLAALKQVGSVAGPLRLFNTEGLHGPLPARDGRWTLMGGLYGTEGEVRQATAALADVLGQRPTLFARDELPRWPTEDLDHVVGLLHGIPTDHFYRRALRRPEGRAGLITACQALDVRTATQAESFLRVARERCEANRVQRLVNLVLLDGERAAAELNLFFDRADLDARVRTQTTDAESRAAFAAEGLTPYRLA